MTANTEAQVEVLAALVQTLIDNDPSEPISDAGHTVLDLWRHDARNALGLTQCPDCDGGGVIVSRATVYEAGCGFSHDDTDERPCPSCLGTGKSSAAAKRDTLELAEDLLKNPLSRPLEVGSRHRALTPQETIERYRDTCSGALEYIRASRRAASLPEPYTGPARDGIEAMRGLNDIWPGDPI